MAGLKLEGCVAQASIAGASRTETQPRLHAGACVRRRLLGRTSAFVLGVALAMFTLALSAPPSFATSKLIVTGDRLGLRSETGNLAPETEGEGASQVSAEYWWGAALYGDGTVWTWGANPYGELGDCSQEHEPQTPQLVCHVHNAVSVAAGQFFGLAAESNGTVMAWGDDAHDELGRPISESSTDEPAAVPNLSNVVAVAAGEHHALALLRSGKVMAWGSNAAGELGNGHSGGESMTPVEVKNLSHVIAIAGGGASSYALTSEHKVYAWGENGYGQLGNESTAWEDEPVLVSRLPEATAIKAGWSHALALTREHRVYSWGINRDGELGTGKTREEVPMSDVPVETSGLSGVTEIGAGPNSSFAVLANGSVDKWGSLSEWNGDITTPREAIGYSNVSSIAAGWGFITGTEGLPQWKVNNVFATTAATNALGSLTLESASLGKVTCETFFGSGLLNGATRGIWSGEGFTTYGCVSSPSCPGSFISNEAPPIALEPGMKNSRGETVTALTAERGASNLPYTGEASEVEGEHRLDMNVRLIVVDPCEPAEIQFEGTLRPYLTNGVKNGLFPSHLEFVGGKDSVTGQLTSPSLPSAEEGNVAYVSGNARLSGNSANQLITAE